MRTEEVDFGPPQLRGSPPVAWFPWVLVLTSALLLGSCRAHRVAPHENPGASPGATETTETEAVRGEYEFSKDWTSGNTQLWKELLDPLVGHPGLSYLEVGVFEGRTVVWMLENVLTHPTSRVTGIDIFPGNLKQTYLANLKRTGQDHRATTLVGLSRVELRKLPERSFDVIYIDGSHTADDVLADAILSWSLLVDDGLLIFDDYRWSGAGPTRSLPPELRPQLAIDAFISTHQNELEILIRSWQVVLRKRKNPCPYKWSCSPIGPHLYDWDTGTLYRQSDESRVELSTAERDQVEKLLKSKSFGETEIVLGLDTPYDAELAALMRRLGWSFRVVYPVNRP